MEDRQLIFGVSDFVAVLNQTLEYAYPNVVIEGELANFRISKNKWVYFDLKDELASVRCFGTVYMMPGPLEDGMVVRVRAVPRLHPLYNFSLNVQVISPVGEGSLKRAADLLQAKLAAEGLFDPERKRVLPYPPQTIGLITSGQSAAYADFVKVIGVRWRGLSIELADVQVQGDPAVDQIVRAVQYFNQRAVQPDVIVLIRGGGSTEDLQAFSTEQVTRAVAASRVPTLVAIGHEVDVSLAELAADQRASTPSNAAELLVPDRKHEMARLSDKARTLLGLLQRNQEARTRRQAEARMALSDLASRVLEKSRQDIASATALLGALNPESILRRGYAIVRSGRHVVTRSGQVRRGEELNIQLADGTISAEVK
jgi:exodeoxyribonuclease VII large subunit